MARIRAKTSHSGRNTLKSMNSFIAVLVHELQGSCKDTHRVTAGPQRHAPQGDRTREFLLIADRPMDNPGGSRSRLPLRFRATNGRSYRVGEFCDAGYAEAPLGPRCLRHPTRRGRRFFASARLQAHNSSRGLFFENNFLPPSGPGLTSNSRAARFDKQSAGHATHAANDRTPQPEFPRLSSGSSTARRNDERCERTTAKGRATAGGRTFRFALGGFAERDHRPLIRNDSL
jgi:hypothetical protein